MSQSNIFAIMDYVKRPTKKPKKRTQSTQQLLAMLFAHNARAKRAHRPKAKIRISVFDQDGNPAVRIRL